MCAALPPSEPRPDRNLPLPAAQPQTGADGLYVWGIDGKSTKLAIGWDGPARGAESWLFPPALHDGERLAAIYEHARFRASVLARVRPPMYVFYEEVVVYSQRPAPILYQACGVIAAAVFEALRYVHAYPVTVAPITTSDWKRRATGYGAAKKHDVLRWAQADGYGGVDQDEADAWCIAVAARRLLEPEPEQLELA